MTQRRLDGFCIVGRTSEQAGIVTFLFVGLLSVPVSCFSVIVK